MRRINSLFVLVLSLASLSTLWAFDDAMMAPLDAYREAVNSNSFDALAPFLTDSFRYMETEAPTSFDVFRVMMSLVPYSISHFEKIQTEPRDGMFLVELDAVVSVGGVVDNIPLAFILTEINGNWKFAAVEEPSEQRYAESGDMPAAVAIPIMMLKGQLFVQVKFAGEQERFMVIHNALPQTVISEYFAKELAVSGERIEYISLGGITRKNFPVQVAKLDSDKMGDEVIVGALGADFFAQYAMLLDVAARRLSLIKFQGGQLAVSIDHFGLTAEPMMELSLLGSYPFNAISVDLGFGFEAPVAVDISVPDAMLFADFFADLPASLMDDDAKKEIADNSGESYTLKYISVKGNRTVGVGSRILEERKFCGYEFPQGIAGIIGASLLGGSRVLINIEGGSIAVYK